MKSKTIGMQIAVVLLALVVTGTLVQAARLPVVRIGIVRDGPWQRRPDAVKRFQKEIQRLTEGQFDVRFVLGSDLDGDWTVAGIRGALARALSDPGIDLVLALGPVAGDVACKRRDLAKPVIAPIVLDARTQNLPNDQGTSGVSNLNYINRMKSLDRDLLAFRSLADFRHLAILVDGYVLTAMPRFIREIRNIGHEFTIDLSIVPVGESPQQALSDLPPETDAVLVGTLLRISAAGFDTLVAGLNQRRLPTFSLWGRDEVKLGILATTAPSGTLDHLARSTAVNVLEILSGENAGDVQVTFTMDEQLSINMATARATDVYPNTAILTEAELLNEERLGQGRTLTLALTVQEALLANRDLLAVERGVAAGEAAVNQARAALLPQLEVGTEAGVIDRDRARVGSGSSPERTWTASATASQILYAEKAWSNFAVEKHLQKARAQERDTVQLDIAQGTALAYVNVLRAKALERIQKNNLRLTRANLQRSQVRQSVGAAGPDEVYRWESQIASDRRAVLNAESATLLAVNNLNRFLHRPLDEAFVQTEVDGDALLFRGQKWRYSDLVNNSRNLEVLKGFLVQMGTETAPELMQLKALIAARERALRSARHAFWAPTVTLQGGVSELLAEGGQGQRGEVLAEIDNTDWRVGVQATLPLFSGGRKSATLHRSRQELAQLQAQYDASRERIVQRILAAVNHSRASAPGVRLSQDAAQTARRNLRLVTDSYSRGIKSIIDLLDAQNLVLIADQRAANARYDYVADIIAVQRAVGQFGIMMSADRRQALIEDLKRHFAEAGIDPVRR